jgi:subtilisin family serine protease
MTRSSLPGSPGPDDPQVKDARTRRYIIVFRDGAFDKGMECLESLGIRSANWPNSDTIAMREGASEEEDELDESELIVYPELGVAVVIGEPEQIDRLEKATHDSSSPILAVEPEKIRTDVSGSNISEELLPLEHAAILAATFDETEVTWGLQITNVAKSATVMSKLSGRGIRVAVLDGGIDLNVDAEGNMHFHPDFERRNITTKTFVPHTTNAKDTRGHGTHCLGTACGALRPANVRRYGIAYNADIYVAKVLDQDGEGPDRRIIRGIAWALRNRCQIISMSISSEAGETFSRAYEHIARRCLDAGLLIVAAAGNDSLRPARVARVGEPANCPSIMAVGGIGPDSHVLQFSNAGLSPGGGEVDIAAPGIDVFSCVPGGHDIKAGTSVATPHVAGIAALYAELKRHAVGRRLWQLLIKNALRLPVSPQDVGAGLVQIIE